jgi:hypothetical protein
MRTLTRVVVPAVAALPATLVTAVTAAVTAAAMAPAAVAAVAVAVAARAWHCTVAAAAAAAAVSWCLFDQKAEDGAQRSGVVPNDERSFILLPTTRTAISYYFNWQTVDSLAPPSLSY